MQILGILKPVDINQLDFEAAEQVLNHDVVHPASLSIHALADAATFQQGFVLLAGGVTTEFVPTDYT